MLYNIKDLHFAYRASGPEVLRGVNLQIREGEILTVLGRNGAGKSTLFSCMLGMKKPRQGTIEIQGRNIASMTEREVATVVGFVPQSHNPAFAYTVEEFVLMGCAAKIGLLSSPGAKEREKTWAALEKMGIAHLANRPYTELSGGERQQVTIARAIVGEPKIILFDEPTAHLDFANQVKVLRIVKSLSEDGYAVAMTTHDPNHALLLGGHTAILGDNGKITWGLTQDIVTQENLEKVYGSDICLQPWPEMGRNVCVFPSL